MAHDFGQNDKQILPGFREVLASHIKVFEATRDHIFTLLRSEQNYSSGIFREGLIRDFFRQFLPQSICVDSGFIYGFEQVTTSRQQDVIIWDGRHSPVYRTRDFVIVAPESVIGVVSVKTNMNKVDIQSATENLMTVAKLDLAYRAPRQLLPIVKIVIAFRSPSSIPNALNTLGEVLEESVASDHSFKESLGPVLRGLNPLQLVRNI